MRRRSSAGIDIVPAAYDDAVARWQRGEDPMDAPFPMHPSYEARAGVPDRAFPWVSPAQGERMIAAWARLIAGSDAMSTRTAAAPAPPDADPRAAAAALPGRADRDAPARHGAEDARRDLARRRRISTKARTPSWWVSQMRAAAHRAAATITISPLRARARPCGCSGSTPTPSTACRTASTSTASPPHRPSADERRELWLRWLVQDPQRLGRGDRRARAASRYAEDEVLDAFFDPTSGEPRPGADVRRAVPRLQARAAADPRLRPGARAHGGAGPAGHLGRRAGRVGGRASPHRRHARGRRRASSSPAGAATTSCRSAWLRRLLRRAVDRRAVRPGVPRGDGLRAARDRRRTAAGRRAS